MYLELTATILSCNTGQLQHPCSTDISPLLHTGSEQHQFVVRDLANVNRSLTPWLVVGGHRPFYIDSTNNMEPDGDQPVARDLQEAFEDAFYKYQVGAETLLLTLCKVEIYVISTNNMRPYRSNQHSA